MVMEVITGCWSAWMVRLQDVTAFLASLLRQKTKLRGRLQSPGVF